MPHLYRTILPVSDMAEADAFWSRLLGLAVDPVVPTRHYLHTAGCLLALVNPGEHGRSHRPNPDYVYFRVPDLGATYARAQEAGQRPIAGEGPEIAERPWGERSFYGLDPFGNPYCVVDDRVPMEPALKGRYEGASCARISKVILPAAELARADAFWNELLGLDVDTRVDNRHFLYCDGCVLALVDPVEHTRAHGLEPVAFRPNPEVVYFSVPDLETHYERTRALGAPPLLDDDVGVGIQQRVWGERSFYVKDPSGNPVCFVDAATLFTGAGPQPAG